MKEAQYSFSNGEFGSRTRTYDIIINSHALLLSELCRNTLAWRRPTLTRGNPSTTIGAKKLNFCVRHRYRCILLAIATTLWRYLLLSKFCSPKLDLKSHKFFSEYFSFNLLVKSIIFSISPLHASLYFHSLPIYLIISQGSYFLKEMGSPFLRWASHLDAFSVYPFPTSYRRTALGRTTGTPAESHPGPLVLRTAPLKFPTPATDKDPTVSRRSEPSSRAALMGEQPNPWDQLQPQDATSRHRSAKPPRRCGLLL